MSEALNISENTENLNRDDDRNLVKTHNESEESIIAETSLPDTVTLLKADNGVSIYLVGTSHFSKESQLDVQKVIQQVQPRVVMLELCPDRTNILSLDEETLLRDAGEISYQSLKTSFKLHGMFQGVLQLLMFNMSAHLTKKFGMAPGGEFRTACNEARKIPNCTIHLGDRPIRITLLRAFSSLNFYQKIKMTFSLLFIDSNISEEDVERCKQRDLLEEMLIQMTGEYPSLSKVFVQERDIFLAHNLKKAAVLAFQKACFGDHAPGASKQRTPEVTNVAEYEADDDGSCDDDGGTDGDGDGGDADGDGGRSGADGDGGGGSADADGGDDNADCCGMERQDVVNCEMPVSVVGVVGIGHCPGITRMWQEEHDILELLTLPPTSRFSIFMRVFIRGSLLGLFGYGCYRVGRFALNVIFPSSVKLEAVSITSWIPKNK